MELEERLHSLFLEKSHESDIKDAQGSAEKANRDIHELRTSLRAMGQSSIPGTGNKKQEFNQIRNSIRSARAPVRTRTSRSPDRRSSWPAAAAR
ncbi:hypothetical protein [Streptomyces capoamus]|uniref:hypothetical protein n=1 Tax=Streptomyces capoamus TaxID=68183 RepID=UPI0033921C9D